MTNNKLIKTHNLPWNPHGNRPEYMFLWVSPDWEFEPLYEEFFETVCKGKKVTPDNLLGFADWLITKGAKDAVTERWNCD